MDQQPNIPEINIDEQLIDDQYAPEIDFEIINDQAENYEQMGAPVDDLDQGEPQMNKTTSITNIVVQKPVLLNAIVPHDKYQPQLESGIVNL